MPTSIFPPAAPDSDVALADSLARWRALVEGELKGVPFEKKLVTRTPEGIALQPVYTRADLAGVPHLETMPGEAPFLRGGRTAGRGFRPWLIAQEIAAATAADFNRALRADLMAGQNAIVVRPDRASRAGSDPDEAPGDDIGADGISLADGDDFAAALDGADLTAVPVFLATGADPLPLTALFLEYARSRGMAWSKMTGSVTADPLAAWAESGRLTVQLDDAYDSLAGWTAWVETYLPALKTIGVSVVHWHNAGATAVQELAFALATAAEYMRALSTRDVSAAQAAARTEFEFAVGPQFFMEVAKFRALRLLWTRVVAALHGDPAVAALARVRAVTGRTDKSQLDPHVNLLRATTQALSAVLGGCDGLHIGAFDEVTGATTDFSRRIARNL
ncbi:MAG TPA: methylmalonyl-CoA mutase family protein, partial [Opitutus sp.]|nr:methylmalonyl-CoA mutase family protein [Opitutus sp.]